MVGIRDMGTRLIVTASTIWWLGAVAVAVVATPAAGIMCAMPPACAIVVALIRRGQISARRAFIHGWHAGYHEASHSACRPIAGDDCSVYLLSERRWTSSA